MQVYTFKCKECGKEFQEVIESPLMVLAVKCPFCGSEELEVVNISEACSPFG